MPAKRQPVHQDNYRNVVEYWWDERLPMSVLYAARCMEGHTERRNGARGMVVATDSIHTALGWMISFAD